MSDVPRSDAARAATAREALPTRTGSGMRAAVPWWMRIGVKIVLSRLPVSYHVWKRLHLFEHGTMDQPHQALRTFAEHATTAGLLGDPAAPARLPASGDFTVLEIGPGDSLFTAVIARVLGASRIWLVDAGPFASTSVDGYIRMAELLRHEGHVLPWSGKPESVADVLRQCQADYLTTGVKALQGLDAQSIDYCFSNAVLEHIPRAEFTELARQLRRVLKPGGVCVHRVDLKDHLGGGLNNLRFSEQQWEGPLFRGAGFYTNRLRFPEILRIFTQAGFSCSTPRVLRWGRLPIPRDRLDPAFQGFNDEDLRISGFDVVLRIPAGPA